MSMMVSTDFTVLSKFFFLKKGKKCPESSESINILYWPISATQHKSGSDNSMHFLIHYNIINEDELPVMSIWMSSIITEEQA